MIKKLPPQFIISPSVGRALEVGSPVLALESAVITHGLPHPHNLQLAQKLEQEALDQAVTPATIAVIDGKIHIGLSAAQLEQLAHPNAEHLKVSRRDIGMAIARRASGGTTVAGTLFAAHTAGIKVFATGGIGGVHRNAPHDISADLPELSCTPMVVVCAGAKAILDLPATVEVLETMGVPVVGFQTDEFPAFYARNSGLPVGVTVESADEVAAIAREHWEAGVAGAVLVVVPPPAEQALPAWEVEAIILRALEDARQKNIHGAAVTPFLLRRISQLSGGDSLRANLALLQNNVSVACQIARAIQKKPSFSV